MRLQELPFSDLYLDTGMDEGLILERPGEVPQNLPQECWADAYKLLDRVQKKPLREFAIEHDGVRYRVSKIPNFARDWWHFRRMPARVWTWDELGMPHRLQDALVRCGRDDGVVLFGGKTGEGKTWSAGATLLAWGDRVGGIGQAIEAPIELPLAGRRERGYVHQRDVVETEFAEEFVSCLRITPRFIMLGETRRPSVAREVLLAGATGHPVLSTLHCGSVLDGLMRLADLATEPGVIGGRKAAYELLAQGLSIFVHQRLSKFGGQWRPRYEVLMAGREPSDPVRVLIREGKLPELSTHIANHTRQLTAA